MRKSFITLGFLIALMPQLGFPESWKNTFFTVSGLLIVLLVSIPRRIRPRAETKKPENSFSERSPE